MKKRSLSRLFLAAVVACSLGVTANIAYAEEKEIVDFWYLWGGEHEAVLEGIIDKYNASQDKYEVVGLCTPDVQKVLAGIASGDGPDITDIWETAMPGYAEEGIAMPLDDLVAKDGTDLSVINDAALKANSYDGKIYALPCNMLATTLYYNKEILAEAGYDAPPTTVEELLEMAAELTIVENGEIVQFGYPMNSSLFIQGAGYSLGTNDDDLNFANDGVKMWLEFLEGLYDTYGDALNSYLTAMGTYNVTDQDYFLNGKQVFRMDSPYVDAWCRKNGFEPGAVMPPSFADQNGAVRSGIGTSNFYIPTTAENVDGAWDFMKYITMGEGAKDLSVGLTNPPALKSLFYDPDITSQYHEVTWQVMEEAELFYSPTTTKLGDMNTALWTAEDAVKLGASAEEAFETLKKAVGAE